MTASCATSARARTNRALTGGCPRNEPGDRVELEGHLGHYLKSAEMSFVIVLRWMLGGVI
jgi:hypothetical protein